MGKIKQLNKLFTRPHNLPHNELYFEGLWRTLPKLTGFHFSVFVIYSKKGVTEIYRNLKESSERFCDILVKKIKKNRNFFSRFSRQYLIATREIKRAAKKLSATNYNFENKEAVLKDINTFSKNYLFANTGMAIVYWLSKKADQDEHFSLNLPKIIKISSTLRKKSEELYALGNQFFQLILDYISRKEKVGIELIENLRLNELKNYFKKSKLVPISKLKERNKGYIIYNNKFFILGNKSLYEFLAERNCRTIKEKISMDYKELRGQSGFKGKVKGKVRVLMHIRKISEFRKGEILIIAMTNTSFLPAMKKAKAIITDEGGLLCHAAIASRELNIPCIIGTKIATKVLKDGDLVEVDAHKGIVKKIR